SVLPKSKYSVFFHLIADFLRVQLLQMQNMKNAAQIQDRFYINPSLQTPFRFFDCRSTIHADLLQPQEYSAPSHRPVCEEHMALPKKQDLRWSKQARSLVPHPRCGEVSLHPQQ